MLELTRVKIEIKLDGQTYSMRMPTYKETIKHQVESKAIANDEVKSSEHLMKYLSELGLPIEVCESLELDHLEKILDFILGAKKKSV